MQKWKIKYYAPSNASSPVYEFIESLSEVAQSKIYQTFELLVEYNVLLRGPHVKKVIGTSLWELRILGTDNIRIFYIAVEESTFLLLHGFKKKQQKTSSKEIQTALKRLAEYRSRK
jgi:phage-related protein